MNRIEVFLVAAWTLAVSAGEPSFVLKAKVDLGDVKAGESLLSAEGMTLSVRMAGADTDLAKYDRASGNYLNFCRTDGSCPVLEAIIAARAGRVGIPLALLPKDKTVHEVIVSWQPPRWAISVDGHLDEDFPRDAADVAWKGDRTVRVHSKRVRDCSFTDNGNDPIPRCDSGPSAGPIQYWTPKGHNAWVGDVAPAYLNGRLHVFYLIDRRHHGSGGGAGRHQFAHLSTDDLVHWQEHPLAVPINVWWQTVGTGTPFLKNGKLAIAFGWHTDRFGASAKGKPIGGTYAISEDGVHFVNSGEIVSEAQNPSIYSLADGRYELVTSYGGSIGIFHSRDLLKWISSTRNCRSAGTVPRSSTGMVIVISCRVSPTWPIRRTARPVRSSTGRRSRTCFTKA